MFFLVKNVFFSFYKGGVSCVRAFFWACCSVSLDLTTFIIALTATLPFDSTKIGSVVLCCVLMYYGCMQIFVVWMEVSLLVACVVWLKKKCIVFLFNYGRFY